MESNKLFILIIVASSLLGFFLGIYNNKIIYPKENKTNENKAKEINVEKKSDEKKFEEKTDIKRTDEIKSDIQKTDEQKTDEKNATDKNIISKDIEEEEEEEKNNEIDPLSINKTIIAVAYATDNKYIYPTIVSMTSLVVTAAKDTFYHIYVMHTGDFNQKSKDFLNTVKEKYPDKCKIIYLNMGNKYKGLSLNFRITTPTYYRLSLQDLLPDVERIVWLDGDTFMFGDLKELIELDMKGAVVMGFLDMHPDSIASFGFKEATVVCGGVLLMDLDGLRRYGYSKKIEDFIAKNKNKLRQQDQTVLNVVMQDRLKPLPPQYGIWAFKDMPEAKRHLDAQWAKLRYNETEYFYAVKHPIILHFVWPKPYWRKKKTFFYDDWWDMAKKTGFYDEIYKNCPIPNVSVRRLLAKLNLYF